MHILPIEQTTTAVNVITKFTNRRPDHVNKYKSCRSLKWEFIPNKKVKNIVGNLNKVGVSITVLTPTYSFGKNTHQHIIVHTVPDFRLRTHAPNQLLAPAPLTTEELQRNKFIKTLHTLSRTTLIELLSKQYDKGELSEGLIKAIIS